MTGWRARAECRDMDTDLFFPGKGVIPREALEACGRCPVTAQCFDEQMAFSAAHQFGVWGGTTALARLRMRRRSRQ